MGSTKSPKDGAAVGLQCWYAAAIYAGFVVFCTMQVSRLGSTRRFLGKRKRNVGNQLICTNEDIVPFESLYSKILQVGLNQRHARGSVRI